MSIIVCSVFDAYCDTCRRTFGDLELEPDTSFGSRWAISLTQARAVMAKHGWHFVARFSRDTCPACLKERGKK